VSYVFPVILSQNTIKMKFSFRFSNLLGCCYRTGNLIFTDDGFRLISPVGNRVSVFDLKAATMETLPFESQMNIIAMSLSPSGNILILVNESGDAAMVNMSSRASLPLYKFHGKVHAISFSPDGKKVAVTQDHSVLVFHAPGQTIEFNPFVLYRTFYGAYDETTCIDWTTNSRAFVVGGKDMHSRVYAAQRSSNLIVYSLSSHKDAIIGVFFERDSLDVYSVSRNGQLFVFQCDTDLCDLTDADITHQQDVSPSSSDEDVEPEHNKKHKGGKPVRDDHNSAPKILYKRLATHNYNEGRDTSKLRLYLTCAAFHKETKVLVAGFDDGSFTVHEMPHFCLLQSFTISDGSSMNAISSVAINKTAEWIALASSEMGQLCVWEWQSQTHVLKQQSHFGSMSGLCYSPDAQYIVTGGLDGKVKVWKTSDGFCIVSFTQHSAAVTGVTFTQTGKVIVSSSLDGTVRAFDMNKYRNFRTFTSPEGRAPCQYNCLAVDSSGEIVVAGTLDSYEIYVWAMQTGRLLEILTGHEGPVSSVAFATSHSTLASGSWDHSVRLWDVFTSKGARSVKPFSCDVLALAYSPDGQQLAVATLNGHISIMSIQSEDITHTIEGRHDLGYTRRNGDKITAKKSADGKSFHALCYTADGKHVLAAGHSKNICIYSTEHQILCKKFEITCNLSLDGTVEFLDRRKMTEWGSLSLVDEGEGDVAGKSVSLPGVRSGDFGSRHWKPEVRVTGVQFSPTGQSFAATTTEGLLVYSLDQMVTFDPFQLDVSVTPDLIHQAVTDREYLTSVMMSFRLNERPLIIHAVEHVPLSEIQYVCRALSDVYIDKLFSFIASQLDQSAEKGFYLAWNRLLLESHGTRLKQRSLAVMPAINDLQKSLRTVQDLNKICMENIYTLRYEQTLARLQRPQLPSEAAAADDEDDDDDDIDASMNSV